jgi:PAS domain-containing protein
MLLLLLIALFCSLLLYQVILYNKKGSVQKRSEEKFKGLLESAPDSIIIVGEKGKIQLVNAQAEKMFGYSRNEMIGQSVEIRSS